MQGASLVPVLQGNTPDDWRKSFYYHYYELGTHNVAAHYGVVTDRYKLVRYYRRLERVDGKRVKQDIDQWDLMDRVADPNENYSYVDQPAYAAIQQQLKAELTRLRTELGVQE